MALLKEHQLLTGKRYGRLLVLEKHPFKGKNSKWLCECDCGNKVLVLRPNLTSGHTTSCGCYNKQRVKEFFTTHAMTDSNAYRSWTDMKTRCYNKKYTGYKNYGERGISVCERWLESFENFLSDMGNPVDGISLERIDNDKGYYPENCKWIPKSEQGKNRRIVRYVSYKGEKISMAELWRREGKKCCYITYCKYLNKGLEGVTIWK